MVKLSDLMAKKSVAKSQAPGTAITLGTIFKQDVLKLKPQIEALINRMPNLNGFLRYANMSKSEFVDKVSLAVQGILETMRIESLKDTPLMAVLANAVVHTSKDVLARLIKEDETLGEFQQKLLNLGILNSTQVVTPAELAKTDI